MNKTKPIALALIAGLASLSSVARAESVLERIATVILAEKFGIDTREVDIFRSQSNVDVYELAPVYEGAHYFHRTPSQVWQLRNQGMGWGQIAHRVGMHPGTFNKLRKQGAFDQDRFWVNSYRERFGVPTERVEVIRRSGGTLQDVLGAILVGKLTKQDPRDVYDQYKTERSWGTVFDRNDVRPDQWRRISTPVRVRYYSLPPEPIKVKVNKSNKGVRDHGEGIGRGKSKGHGKDNSHSQGHGKSKGKGKGKGKGGG